MASLKVTFARNCSTEQSYAYNTYCCRSVSERKTVICQPCRYLRRLPRPIVDIPWTPKINWHPPPRSMAIAYLPRNSGDLDHFLPAEYRKKLETEGRLVPRHFRESSLFQSADPVTQELLSAEHMREKELYEIYKFVFFSPDLRMQ